MDNLLMEVYAQNLTPGSRINEWSDEEFKLAIREGFRPDGSLIGPPMPFYSYRKLSDNDLESIILYLRQIPAVENDLPNSTYTILNLLLPSDYGQDLDIFQTLLRMTLLKEVNI